MVLPALWNSKFVGDFFLALAFLTTMPLPARWAGALSFSRPEPGRAFAWYPAVALLIGLLLTGLAWLIQWAFPGSHNPTLQAGLLLLAWVAITGGLHLDGVMDSCDALLAPVSVERRLVILKDVHPGAFGVIGLFFVLGFKWVLLAGMVGRPGLMIALVLAPLWGRWMLVWSAQRFAYVGSVNSLGRTMTMGLSARQVWIATFFSLLVQIGLGLWVPLSFVAVLAPLAGLLLARWAANQLGGGLTGDLYGFLCEVVELLVLFFLHALLT